MLKKMPIRLRLTVLSVLLLAVCCVGLTVILNLSANRMANVIEAAKVTPATKLPSGAAPLEEPMPSGSMAASPTSEATAAAKTRFSKQSIYYMLLVVAVGGGLTYYISGKTLKPLQELSSQMKNRTVHNLSEELPIPESRDEIAALTIAFNEMSNKLDDAFVMQRRFSQSAAHELRTPLTVLKTKVDVFKKKEEHTAEEYDSLLSIITTHSNRLADLVTDLLNLTNMDALSCNDEIELKTMLLDVCEDLSALARDKNVVVTICGEQQTVKGNQSLLHRAFYNVVENAIKYNSDKGTVDIAIISGEKRATVTITDSGIGIPAEQRELIFEPFFRVDKSRSRQMGGAGLGLSTVKTIVEKHHGQISALENPLGGTVFEIVI